MRFVKPKKRGSSFMPNAKTLMVLGVGVMLAGLVSGLRGDLDAASNGGDALLLVRIDQLSRTVDALNRRVAMLENASANNDAARAQATQRVTAPFEVVDKSGKAILSVSDGTYGDATTRGRVHIGRGNGDNYGLWVRGADGNASVVIREQVAGVGGVFVMDKKGISRVGLSAEDDRAISVMSSASKEIASLGPDPKNKAAGMLRVVDQAGNAVADIGANDRRITGPFVVADNGGKPIMSVSDVADATDSKPSRIRIGRGSGDNYGIWVRRGDQTLAATVAETKDGDGLITVRDKAGKLRAELWAANGINLYDPTGTKTLMSLAPGDAGTSVRMKLTGSVQLSDKGGKTVFEAGESQRGGGLAHVFAKDGTIRTEMSDDGVRVVSPSGKHVVSMELNPTSSSGGIVDISGQLHVFDANGTTTVEIGTVPSGSGVVRVGPNFQCGPSVAGFVANIPSCLLGRK